MRSHPSCRHRGRGQLSFRRNRRQQRKRQSRAHRRALFETLEPRHLLAADTVARLEAAIVSQTDGSQWLDTAGVDLATANSVIAAASSPSQPLLVNDLSDLDDNLLGLNGEPGSLSLREAIRLANADIAPDTIMFDPALFATPQTITLGDTDGDGAADVTGTELLITSELSITAPAQSSCRLTLKAQAECCTIPAWQS